MPETVADIMDPEFFHACQTDPIGQLLRDMTELGLGSAPVLDDAGHPLGVATLHEIDGCRRADELAEHLKTPAVSVHQNTSVETAAKTLAESNADWLILVDDRGVAVGALRAVDLLRALLGLRIHHADRSAARRPSAGWSRGMLLDVDAAHHAPAVPGVILLDPGGAEAKPNIVWVEAAENIRERLDEMLRLPQDDPALEALLAVHPRRVIFRAQAVSDPERRARLVRSLRAVLARRRGEPTS
ncbi:MAG: CBS domain-containing protein [Deltaproteobacteria bacterium]